MVSRFQRAVGGAVALAALTTAQAGCPTQAQAQTAYHGRKAWALQNDKIKVLIVPGGGHIASLTLLSGRGANVNPLWQPPWKSVETGQWAQAGGAYGDKPGAQLLSSILGHNICLDFFGSPSPAETAAGIPAHGEAPALNWTATQTTAGQIVYGAQLPAAQLNVTRSMTLVPHSSALWITETVTNLSALDRPFGWTQHVTLGPPFLEKGQSFYDLNGGWSQVDPKEFSKGQRLKRGEEFEWPNAPGANGETVDLREWPKGDKSSDFTTSQISPDHKWGYFTCINKKLGLLIGYVWPAKDWPWAANWEENRFRTGKPWLGKAVARGIEFGTTPFAYTRRESVTMGKLHGTPTYRWISAKARQTIGYGAFLASLPAGTTGVKNVQVEGRSIKISLEGVEKTITLPVKR